VSSEGDHRRKIGIAVSPGKASFAPLLFAGRIEEAVQTAVDLQLDCLELSVRDPEWVSSAELRALLETSGLTVSAVATGQACLADGLCLAATDKNVRAAAVERFVAQIALAAEFDAAVILGGVRGRLVASGAERERRHAEAVEAIRECAAAAAASGVAVMLEPINRYEIDFVRTAEEGLALIEEVASPALRLLLDSFHMNIEERSMAAAIRRAGDLLGYVHLADSNRHAPGQGHVDFGEVFEALDEVGYQGPLVSEILPLPDDLTAARHAAEFLRTAVGAQSSAQATGGI
jgi:sugar phosphate isomerase/epimerase